MENMPIETSGQLELDFPICTPGAMQEVQKVSNVVNTRLINNGHYLYESKTSLNGDNYTLTIGHSYNNQATIAYDEYGNVKRISFSLRGEKHKLRFDVAIDRYSVSVIPGDEDSGKHISNLQIKYINKTDKNKGGARYKNGKGEDIVTFNYFRYIFGEGAHTAIIKELKFALLKIHSQNE